MVDNMLNKLMGSPETAGLAHNLIKSPATKQKLEALVGPARAQELIRRMHGEAQMHLDYTQALQGSKTARTLSGIQEAGEESGEAAANVALGQGSLVAFVLAKMTGALRDRYLKMDDATRQRIGALMQQTDPATAQSMMEEILSGSRSVEGFERLMRAGVLGAAGTAGGAL
jgi:hypothetical protein